LSADAKHVLALAQLTPVTFPVVDLVSDLQSKPPLLVVTMRPPGPVAKHLVVVGQLIASKAALEPACGSLARLKLSAQVAPPFVVSYTLPGPTASTAKHADALGQLTPVRPAAVTRTGALQLAPPSTVLIDLPCESTAIHAAVVGQLIPVNGWVSAFEGQVWPLSMLE
jgi:hypothetical protein